MRITRTQANDTHHCSPAAMCVKYLYSLLRKAWLENLFNAHLIIPNKISNLSHQKMKVGLRNLEHCSTLLTFPTHKLCNSTDLDEGELQPLLHILVPPFITDHCFLGIFSHTLS